MDKKVHIYIALTNDISVDQRVQKIADTLVNEGHIVTVCCRKLPRYPSHTQTNYTVHYKKLWFNKGILMYASFNIFLFFELLFSKFHIVTANDLDTLPACAMVACLKRKYLVYDSHELFLELPELKGRKLVKWVWTRFETFFIKKSSAVSTVCESIARELTGKYKKQCTVIRNVPIYRNTLHFSKKQKQTDFKILLYQGSLNMGRGLELMIGSMLFLYDAKLVIAGTGYMEKALKQMVVDLELQEKVVFVGMLSPQDLYDITCSADLGLSLEENVCKNYEFALPNKLFDYIQARVPVLTSDLPEMKKITEKYKVGTSVNVKESYELALIIKNIFEHEHLLQVWKNNCNIAASDLCWEKERSKLIEMYNTVILNTCN